MESSTDPEITTFEDLFHYLHEFDWLHSFQVTKFFTSCIWNKMPIEWSNILLQLNLRQMKMLPFEGNEGEADYPESLRGFLEMSHRLSIERSPSRLHPNIDASPLTRGMSPKKLHEVSNMAAVVKDVALKAGCDVILDVGSGLGYLDQAIHKMSGFPVVGVEGCSGHTEKADLRSAKQDFQNNCIKNITYRLQQDDDHLVTFQDKVHEAIDDLRPCNHSRSNGVASSHCLSVLETKGVEQNKNMGAMNLEEPSDNVKKEVNQIDEDRLRILSSTENTTSQPISKHCFSLLCSDNTCTGCVNRSHEEICLRCNHGNRDINISRSKDSRSETDPSQSRAKHGGRFVSMIGLHCCGDLTPMMLQYFLHMPSVRSLCLVSCCYHKMEFSEGSQTFLSFPMSKACRTAYGRVQAQHPGWQLRPVSMRLAAQETRTRWLNQTEEEHETHTRHVAYRGLLDVFLEEANMEIALDRKHVRKADYSNFPAFTESIIKRLNVSNEKADKYRHQLQQIHIKNNHYFKYIEIITCLQVIVQPVLETLLHNDRLGYLTDHHIQAHLVPIFDDNVSPRNIAIIANKV